MKKITAVFSVLLLIVCNILLPTACQSTPVASFDASTLSGEAPVLITFTNSSENADEFRWDFGDGSKTVTSSIEETVNHEYRKAGDYTVELTALKSKNPSQTSTMDLSVSIKPGGLASINITPENVNLAIGAEQYFKIECLDSCNNIISDYQLDWEVVNDIGTISDGNFKAGTTAGTYQNAIVATVKAGTITYTNTSSVTINPGPLSKVSGEDVYIAAGESTELEFVPTDEYGNILEGLESSSSVLKTLAGTLIDDSHFTAGKKAGKYDEAIKIEVEQDDILVETLVDVEIIPGELVQVVTVPEEVDIGIEMTQQLVAVGADKYGNRISDADFEWSVDGNFGTIDDKGLFKAGATPGDFKDGITVAASVPTAVNPISTSIDVTVEQDHILFYSNRQNEDSWLLDIYIMDIDGNNIKRLTRNSGDYSLTISYTPDGRRIVFSDNDGIYAMNVDGTWQVPILSGRLGFEASVSADGTKIVFQSWEHEPSEIYTMDIDGGNLKRLTDNSAYDDYPAWSPDGSKIVYASERNGALNIYTVNADGSNEECLTSTSSDEYLPEWSPDGTEILFESNRNGRTWGIYAMNIDGSNTRTLRESATYSSSFPGWSHDGSKVVFTSYYNNQFDIYLMDRDGSNVKRLTDSTAADIAAVWLPRMKGVQVSEVQAVVPDMTDTLVDSTTQQVTAQARDAIVKIETDLGSGSGFIIDSKGLILTNNHVVTDAKEITVYLDDGTSYDGEVFARDLIHDIAIVSINETDLPFLETGDLGEISLGQQLIVLGYPLDKDNLSVTSGLVSAIEYDPGRNITWVQTDSAINPGNSGGPMLTLQGRVVGVVSMKLVGISVEGVGYGISANTLKAYLPRLLNGETIKK